jgi:leucyl aminopeptidase (aminopeptidase T)
MASAKKSGEKRRSGIESNQRSVEENKQWQWRRRHQLRRSVIAKWRRKQQSAENNRRKIEMAKKYRRRLAPLRAWQTWLLAMAAAARWHQRQSWRVSKAAGVIIEESINGSSSESQPGGRLRARWCRMGGWMVLWAYHRQRIGAAPQ